MNLNTIWVLQVNLAVYKSFKKIPHIDAERILMAINELSVDQFIGAFSFATSIVAFVFVV